PAQLRRPQTWSAVSRRHYCCLVANAREAEAAAPPYNLCRLSIVMVASSIESTLPLSGVRSPRQRRRRHCCRVPLLPVLRRAQQQRHRCAVPLLLPLKMCPVYLPGQK
ncbi:unnamed protein product, partial [Ectocarpus sp. 8 AP-2014]